MTSAFGANVRRLRDAQGLTRQQLADRAGLHVMTVASVEQGRRSPVAGTLLALAEALDVPLVELIQEVEVDSGG